MEKSVKQLTDQFNILWKSSKIAPGVKYTVGLEINSDMKSILVSFWIDSNPLIKKGNAYTSMKTIMENVIRQWYSYSWTTTYRNEIKTKN